MILVRLKEQENSHRIDRDRGLHASRASLSAVTAVSAMGPSSRTTTIGTPAGVEPRKGSRGPRADP